MPPSPKHDRPLSREVVEAAIEEMLGSGECSIADERNGKIFRLRPTKIGQKQEQSASIEQINEFLKDIGLVLSDEKRKRIYRRSSDLPDPNRHPKDEVNRTTKMVGVRIDPERLERFNELAVHFSNKREALERAIELLESDIGDDSDPSP